jgi:chromosome segregation ATPase
MAKRKREPREGDSEAVTALLGKIETNAKARLELDGQFDKLKDERRRLNREADDLDRELHRLRADERRAAREEGRQDAQAPGAVVEGKSGSK